MDTPLNIAVCEDRPGDRDLLLERIAACGIPARCETFACGEDLLAAFAPGRYDLIFMDIYMTGMNGVAAAGKIQEADETVLLAFTTTSPDYTRESYRLGAPKYLEKPAGAGEIRETLELACLKRRSAAYITLLIGGKRQEISLAGILYFEQQNHAVAVHTAAGTLQTGQQVTLSRLEPLLPPAFLRCHHSYIAHLRYVHSLDRELRLFTMSNGDRVYIRRQDLKKATGAYEDYLFRAARGGSL